MGILDGLMGHGSVADPAKLAKHMDGVLIEGETVRMAYRVIRDSFVSTLKRLILVGVQGMTGIKVDYVSILYRAITRFSVETAGTFDLDAELKVWVSGSNPPVSKTLKKGTDVRAGACATCADVTG